MSEMLRERQSQFLFISDIVPSKDVDGKEYIDFTCMLGVVNQGHSHPRILEAVTKQLQDGKDLLNPLLLHQKCFIIMNLDECFFRFSANNILQL